MFLHVWTETHIVLAREPVLDTNLLITRPGMSNLQLFPVSSLLIGSTLLVDSIADGTPAVIQLELSWVWAPGEPDCACLFRSLESILCSVREDSCYYSSVLFFSSIPSSSAFSTSGRKKDFSWELSHSGRQIFATWHPFNEGFTYFQSSPRAIPHSFTFQEMWIGQNLRKRDSLCCRVNCACVQWHLIPAVIT